MITEFRNILYTSIHNQTGSNGNDAFKVLAKSVFSDFSIEQLYPNYPGYCQYAWTELTTTGFKFPGSQNVNYKTSNTGFWLTLSHLVKNDLNGHFLTDQPGQPFNGDPGNTTGFEVLIYLISNLVVQNGNGTQFKSIYSPDILTFALLAKLLADEFNF